MSSEDSDLIAQRVSHTSAVDTDGAEVDVDVHASIYWKRRSSSFSRPKPSLFGLTKAEPEPDFFNVRALALLLRSRTYLTIRAGRLCRQRQRCIRQ